MKSNVGRWAVVVLLSIDLFGCTSIRARNETPNQEWKVYPGPRKAVNEMGDIFSSRRSEPDWIKGVITAILVVDLPITTVFDTVAVPYDVYRIYNPEDFEKTSKTSESSSERKAESQKAE